MRGPLREESRDSIRMGARPGGAEDLKGASVRGSMLDKDFETEICGVQVGSCPGRGMEGLGKVIGMIGLEGDPCGWRAQAPSPLPGVCPDGGRGRRPRT